MADEEAKAEAGVEAGAKGRGLRVDEAGTGRCAWAVGGRGMTAGRAGAGGEREGEGRVDGH